MWLKPVMFVPSLAKPPCFSPITSATAFAIEKGKLAPGKAWPPLTVPIRGSMKERMLAPDWAWAGRDADKSIASKRPKKCSLGDAIAGRSQLLSATLRESKHAE